MTVPLDQCTAFGRVGERLVARLTGGRMTRPNHPVDVITDGYAVEVKTLDATANNHRTYMSRAALRRKNKWAREQCLEALTVLVVVHWDRCEVYAADGFGNLDADGMEYVGTFPR